MNFKMQKVFLQVFSLVLVTCLLSFLVYGGNFLLSGDQSPQLAAAISVVNGEGLRVPPSFLESRSVFDPALATRDGGGAGESDSSRA
jgi:hypothetical protein